LTVMSLDSSRRRQRTEENKVQGGQNSLQRTSHAWSLRLRAPREPHAIHARMSTRQPPELLLLERLQGVLLLRTHSRPPSTPAASSPRATTPSTSTTATTTADLAEGNDEVTLLSRNDVRRRRRRVRQRGRSRGRRGARDGGDPGHEVVRDVLHMRLDARRLGWGVMPEVGEILGIEREMGLEEKRERSVS
jgi:hypothetical protein